MMLNILTFLAVTVRGMYNVILCTCPGQPHRYRKLTFLGVPHVIAFQSVTNGSPIQIPSAVFGSVLTVSTWDIIITLPGGLDCLALGNIPHLVIVISHIYKIND